MGIHLTTEDLDRIIGAIDIVSGITDPGAFARAAVEAAQLAVPCEIATYNEVARDGTTRVAWFPEERPPPPDTAEILEKHAHEHPLIAEIQRTGDGSPRAISDFLTAEEFRERALFRLLFEPFGLTDQLAIGLPAPAPVIIGIALCRERRGFDERDRFRANMIRPYLVQSHRATRLLASVHAATAVGLDNRVGVLVHGRNLLEPMGGEWPAWVSLDETFPNGGMDRTTWDWFEAEHRRELDEPGLPRLARSLVRQGTSGRRILRYVPTRGGAMIVVSRGWKGADDPEWSLRALGLTAREAEVLHLVTKGASNREVEEVLGVSASTVKRHMEALLRKLGVRNRAEAAALAVDTIAHG